MPLDERDTVPGIAAWRRRGPRRSRFCASSRRDINAGSRKWDHALPRHQGIQAGPSTAMSWAATSRANLIHATNVGPCCRCYTKNPENIGAAKGAGHGAGQREYQIARKLAENNGNHDIPRQGQLYIRGTGGTGSPGISCFPKQAPPVLDERVPRKLRGLPPEASAIFSRTR